MNRMWTVRKSSLGRRRQRAGFTIVELLVVITIIAGLIALAFPAIQAARATAPRTSSQSNPPQLARAIVNSETQNGNLPVAARVTGKPRLGWVTEILPQLDRKDLYDRYDF